MKHLHASRVTTTALALALLAALGMAANADAQGCDDSADDGTANITPGGWVTQCAAARANACAHERAFPGHAVNVEHVGTGPSWSSAVAIETDVAC